MESPITNKANKIVASSRSNLILHMLLGSRNRKDEVTTMTPYQERHTDSERFEHVIGDLWLLLSIMFIVNILYESFKICKVKT